MYWEDVCWKLSAVVVSFRMGGTLSGRKRDRQQCEEDSEETASQSNSHSGVNDVPVNYPKRCADTGTRAFLVTHEVLNPFKVDESAHILTVCGSWFHRKKLRTTCEYIYDTLFLGSEGSDLTVQALGRVIPGSCRWSSFKYEGRASWRNVASWLFYPRIISVRSFCIVQFVKHLSLLHSQPLTVQYQYPR